MKIAHSGARMRLMVSLFCAVFLTVAWVSVPAAVPTNPELVSLVERVVDTYPTIQAARASKAAAESELSATRWSRFPSLTVEGFSSARSGGSTSSTIALEQPLWTGGRIKASVAQAKARVDVAAAVLAGTALDVALRTCGSYVEYLRLGQRERILEEGVEEHQRLVDSIQRRVDQQVSPESDLDYAVQRLLLIQQDLIQSRTAAQVALNRLRELSGNPELTVKALLYYNPAEHVARAADVVRAALEFDPLARRLKADIDVATAESAIRKAAIFPQLNVQAAHYTGADYLGYKDRIGLVLRVQTDGGFSRLAGIRAANQREQAARASAEGGVRDVREQVVADLSENSVAAARIDAGSRAAIAARQVTESYLRQFTAGRRTWPEVLNVVREGVSARITEVDAKASAVSSALRIQLRSGEWRPGELAVTGSAP